MSCLVEQLKQRRASSFIRHTDTERVTWRRLAQQWHPHRLWLGITHPVNLLPFCDDPRPTTVNQAVALLNVGFQRPQALMRSLPSRVKQKPPGVFFMYWTVLKHSERYWSRNRITYSNTCWFILKETAPAPQKKHEKTQKPTNGPQNCRFASRTGGWFGKTCVFVVFFVTFLWSILLWLGFTRGSSLQGCMGSSAPGARFENITIITIGIYAIWMAIDTDLNKAATHLQETRHRQSNCPRHNLHEMNLKWSFNIEVYCFAEVQTLRNVLVISTIAWWHKAIWFWTEEVVTDSEPVFFITEQIFCLYFFLELVTASAYLHEISDPMCWMFLLELTARLRSFAFLPLRGNSTASAMRGSSLICSWWWPWFWWHVWSCCGFSIISQRSGEL